MTAEEIAQRFDISLPSARIRAEEIARLSRRQTGKLRPLPRSVEDFLINQKRRGFNVTSVTLEDEK